MAVGWRAEPVPDRRLNRACLLSGLGAAIVMAGLTGYFRRWGWQITDFDQLWFAGRALLTREDPYRAWIGAGLQYPLYYPLHAVVLTLPLAVLPLDIARIALVALTAFVAGFGLRRLGRWWVLAIASPGWWGAALQGQMAPGLAGAALVPSLGFVLAAKPTVGLALFVSRPSRRALAGILILTVLCFLIRPDWTGSWLHAIGDAPHIRAPITRPGGVLLGLAFMPPPSADLAYRTAVNWPVMLTLIYIPALLVVLAPALEAGFNRVRDVVRAAQ
jgi:hypothetical protein